MTLNKYIKYYGILWIFGFVIFNVVTFVIPHDIGGVDRLKQNGFWIGYILMVFAFLGQLVCAYIFFKDDSKEKVFLNLPIIKLAKRIFVVSVIIAIVFSLIPALPIWLGSIICLLAMFGFLMSGVKARVAAEAVSTLDEKVKTKTSFIYSLRADAESLVSYAKTDESKKAAKAVYEAVKFSDPVSIAEVDEIEQDIFDLFTEFSANIKNGEFDKACLLKEKILNMLKERNVKVKSLKN